LAGWTRLELATFCVTGRRSNQLSYHPVVRERGRNVDLAGGLSSVVWKLPRGRPGEKIQGAFPVIFNLLAELLQAAELALGAQEMKPAYS
jgi:hypothetical protein